MSELPDPYIEETTASVPPTMEVGVPPLDMMIRTKLSIMMFLQYFVWGAWWVTLGTYLSNGLGFSGTQVGLVYGTSALAAIVSPFFVGIVADRLFATQRILAVLHLLGGLLLYAVAQIEGFRLFYVVSLVYFLCYMPTLALTNSLSFHQMSDPSRQFPGIRVLGTIGWIVAGLIVGAIRIDQASIEATNLPIQIAAGVSILLGIFCLALPHTPPKDKGTKWSIRAILGLDALELMKQWSFTVFIVGSFLICIPLQFYYAFANPFLNDLGVTNAVGKMTMGQMSEIFFMLVMPFFFARLGVKYMLLVGMLAWTTRYVLFAYGDAESTLGMGMLLLGILLHGICYDFFFVTGQIYVDNKAPQHIRGAAQGFIALVTLGVGGFVGTLVSGRVVDYFTSENGQHDWTSTWLTPAIGAGVIMIAFGILFNDRTTTSNQ